MTFHIGKIDLLVGPWAGGDAMRSVGAMTAALLLMTAVAGCSTTIEPERTVQASAPSNTPISAPTPVAAAQPDAAYKIGVDDVLIITVWDNKDADQTVFVRPDGKISLPLVGEVQAGGLTVAELAEKLNVEYSKTIKSPAVTVSVREIRSRTVFFVGGVGKPGPMQLTQELTVLQAVSLAGGIAPTADDENAYVLRNGAAIPVNFTAIMKKGDLRQNIVLKPGDTVVVPIADPVFVQGEVKTPGTVKFRQDLTVVKAITEAGGVTPMAAPKRVEVVRGTGAKKQTLKVNVDAIMQDSAQDMALQPGDIIRVPQRLF